MFEYSRVFNIQAYQLAEALHDHVACPYSHRETSKSYIPRKECPRIPGLVEKSYHILLDAHDEPFRPFSSITVNGETYEQPALDLA